ERSRARRALTRLSNHVSEILEGRHVEQGYMWPYVLLADSFHHSSSDRCWVPAARLRRPVSSAWNGPRVSADVAPAALGSANSRMAPPTGAEISVGVSTKIALLSLCALVLAP